jgi:hypothetical protein
VALLVEKTTLVKVTVESAKSPPPNPPPPPPPPPSTAAPPAPPSAFPLEIVRLEIEGVPDSIKKGLVAPVPETVTVLAWPSIVYVLVMIRGSPVRVIVIFPLKLMVSGEAFAAVTAARKVPAPLSAELVTVIVPSTQLNAVSRTKPGHFFIKFPF